MCEWVRACVRMCVRACMRARWRALVYACASACVRSCVLACVRVCKYENVCTCECALFLILSLLRLCWNLATKQTAKRSFNKQAMLSHHTITCVRGLNIALVPIIYVQCLCLDTRNHTDSEKQYNININVPATYSNMCMGYKAETQTPGSMQELRRLLHLINYIL